MKIKELIYQSPEMSEEKLLKIIHDELPNLIKINNNLINRIRQIYNCYDNIDKYILKEFDIIQDKKSYLTRSERNLITGFVGSCLIEMTKNDGSRGNDSVDSIQDIQEVG